MGTTHEMEPASNEGRANTKQADQAEKASLLSIPTETRLQIYSYLFRVNSTVPFLDGVRTCEWSPFPGHGLIASCRKLYEELQDLMYIKNTLRFHITFSGFDYYTNSINPKPQSLILDPNLKKLEKALSSRIAIPNLLSPLNEDAIARLRRVAIKLELADWQFREGYESIWQAFGAFATIVADETGKPHNLHSLTVNLCIYASHPSRLPYLPHLPQPANEAWANCIEPLAHLYNLRSVEIYGPIQPPFREMLVWVMTRTSKVCVPPLATLPAGRRLRALRRNEKSGTNGFFLGKLRTWEGELAFALQCDWSGVTEMMEL